MKIFIRILFSLFFIHVLQGCGASNSKITYDSFRNNPNPSKELQLRYIREHGGDTIRMIKNPSESVQLAAIKDRPSSYIRIQNPSDAASRLALKLMTYSNTPASDLRKYHPIKRIRNPTEEEQIRSIKMPSGLNNGGNVKFIKKPTEAVQLLAVKDSAENIKYIKNPTKRVQLYILENAPAWVEYIKNPAIKKHPKYLAYKNEQRIAKLKKKREEAEYEKRRKEYSSSNSSSSSSSSNSYSAPQRTCRNVTRTKTVYVPGGNGRTALQNYTEVVCN